MWDDLRAHHARTARRRFETLFDDKRAEDFSAAQVFTMLALTRD